MSPEFAKAIDPIFEATLKFIERIERSDRLVAADERATLLRRIDDAEIRLGSTPDWQFAKYALCAWIDAQLIDAPWDGKSWWKDNCLEKKYFGRRDAHQAFFQRAQESANLGSKNALEVYYVAVVLGFRGFYADPDASYRANLIAAYRLPDSIEAWCHATARSLQLRQGRPEIPESIQVGGSAKPLTGKQSVKLYSLVGIVMLAIAIATAMFVYRGAEVPL
ncbi:MAG: DotU family type IV/VI secretion system protein [Planctomycetales bacterium]|nr:DotU family type IV/VI secretion system protein [Planctomycetales bacterium]